MSSDDSGSRWQWLRFGFLFADLFTALAMLFLIANTAGAQLPVISTPTPAVVIQCALERTPLKPVTFTLTTDQAIALRNGQPAGTNTFKYDVESAFSIYSERSAGLVEIFGGSYHGVQDAGNGISLALGASAVLKNLLSHQPEKPGDQFMYSSLGTIYQEYWDESLNGNQVKILFFLYQQTPGLKC